MKKKSNNLFKIFVYVALAGLAISILIPVAWVFMASIKENPEFYGNAWSLPKGFYWQNFIEAWTKAKMGEYFLNSIIVTGLAIVILLVVSIPCAYVLSRMELKAQNSSTTTCMQGCLSTFPTLSSPFTSCSKGGAM